MKSKHLRFNNTYESGTLTFLYIQDKKRGNFIGVCLEFDLEVEAKTFLEVQEKIEDYAKLWLENVRVNKLSEELLNKAAPEKYWKIVNELEEQRKSRTRTIENYTSSIKMPVSTSFFRYNDLFPF